MDQSNPEQSNVVPGAANANFDDNPLKDARSSVATFQLPNGWLNPETGELQREVQIKEMTGVEEDMLASNKTKAHVKMDQLMTNCVTKLGDTEDKEKIRTRIRHLVNGDRLFLILKIREVSVGKVYSFKCPCPECDDDKKMRQVDISEIEVKPLEDPKKRQFEETLPSGSKVQWSVMTGLKEAQSNTIAKKSENLATAMIVIRVDSINGQAAGLMDCKRLSTKDRSYLRTQFMKREGEIDDKAQIECDQCGHEFEADIDIGQTGFFFPTAS